MKKTLLSSYPEVAVNKIKELLCKSKDRILDENLLGSLEGMCEDLGSHLKNEKIGTGDFPTINEQDEKSAILEEKIQEERRIFDNIIQVIGAGLCLIDKDSKITWANDTLQEWLDLNESPVGSHCSDIYRCNVVGTNKCPAAQIINGKEGHVIQS